MDPNRWKRVQELFAAALARAPAFRSDYLRGACDGDERLVAEVSSLLDAHEDAADVLDRAAGAAAFLDGVEVGSRVGRYRVEARIGGGAMGVVYRAYDTQLERNVALKFLPAYLSDVEDVKTRFVNEARAASALDHPNICTVHEIGETSSGSLYIAMALCEGRDLGRHLAAERLDWRQALQMTAQLAAALDAAHRRGIVHRDLKPANVIVGPRFVRIVDFGIAKIAGVDLTEHGIALGTPAYMSPEQLRGARVDARTDVWALGVMLYEMLCGERPFRGSDARAVLEAMTERAPKPLLEHDTKIPAAVASALQAVLDLCLAVDPDERYPSMRELLADLQHLGAGGDEELGLQTSAAPRQPLEADAPSGELRRMTVLQCVFTADDPELLFEALPQLKQLSARVVTRFEGVVTEPGGETVLAWFGYPRAHEDDAARAARAGLSVIAGVTELARAGGRAVQVRAAVVSGTMVMRATGGVATLDPAAMIGAVARDASTLAAFAPASALLVSGEARALIGSRFECLPHGEVPLGAGRAAETVYRVAGESTARPKRGDAAAVTRLVGREHELAMLEARWDDACEGRGQCLLVSGEPGIGKSRLLQALAEHVSGVPSAWLAHCHCSSHQRNSALHPIIEWLLESELAVGGVGAKLDRIEGLLAEQGVRVAEAAPLLAGLLSLPSADRYPPLQLSAERQRQKTFDVLLKLLLGRAAQQPVLFVAEDLHWADPTFVDLIAALVQHVPGVSMLAVFTARPEFDFSRVKPSHVGHINLGRLTDGQVRGMIAEIAGGRLRDEEIATLTQQTDGVPLFVEELTKSVLEAREANGSGGEQAFTVPATLQESLAARLHRLGPAKATAQRASMLGRAFDHLLLHALDERGEGELDGDLEKLVASGLLYRRGLGDEAAYVFKHALIQEAAYGSMLPRDRRRQHGRIADVLLQRFDARCEREPELPARHLTAAGRGAEAIPWWVKAGKQAQRRSASREAVAHFNAALDLLDALDGAVRAELELATRTAMGPALMALGGYTAPEVERTYQRALVLAREQGETPRLVPVLFGLWTYYVVRAEFAVARSLGEQLLRLADAAGDDDLLLEACTMLGVTLFHTGEIEQARAYLERGIALYDRERHAGHALVYGQDPGMACRCYLASALWWQGYADRALAVSDEAIALARGLRHAHSLTFGLYFSARFRYQRGDLDVAIALADEAVALGAEYGFPIWQTLGAMVRGRAYVERGERERGAAEIAAARTLHVSRGAGTSRPYFLALYADALGQVGRIAEALKAVDDALADALATGAHTERAEILRIRADLRGHAGDREAAEAGTREALDLALEQGARAFALRAAMQLARLLQESGRAAAARAVLEPVHSDLDEGFATRDLAEAAQLLAALE
jgi:TOMM system kinase/cyclase fusion protein